MENYEVQTSPQVYARIGGVPYLITIVVGSVIADPDRVVSAPC